MASSATNTIEAYIAGLPLEQREVVSSMRRLVNAHMPPGYEEVMNWGMISWQIPLVRYPVTYNKQPLSYVALAARKNTCALHLMGVYADGEQEHKLLAAAAALGKKLDVDPSQFKIVGNKLYLNVNADVFQKWSQDVPGNIAKADQNWPAIKGKAPSAL